jgi:hypothetical protein
VGEARRVQELGVRVVEKTEGRAYRFFHFHPSDFGGVLTSFDEVRVGGDMLEDHSEWPAAGREWRAARTDFVRDIVSVTLTGPDPYSLSTRWSELLGRKLAMPGRLRLDRGEILFAQGGYRARIAEITLAVADPARVPAEGVLIGGVRFRAVR